MTSWNGSIFRVTVPLCGEFTGPSEFPTQRPVTRSFDVFFDLRLNKRLRKQPRGWWFETPLWSLWRHCNGIWMNTSDHRNPLSIGDIIISHLGTVVKYDIRLKFILHWNRVKTRSLRTSISFVKSIWNLALHNFQNDLPTEQQFMGKYFVIIFEFKVRFRRTSFTATGPRTKWKPLHISWDDTYFLKYTRIPINHCHCKGWTSDFGPNSVLSDLDHYF